MPYDVDRAIEYARRWAFGRNPRYYNFDALGGDCTNFVSQCLYAGCGVMNYTPNTGWYYISLNNRAPAWTGVPFLYNFLVNNKGPGPYGREAPLHEARPGDVIQLSFDGVRFSHSLFVVSTGEVPRPDNILIATHTYDSYNRPLSTYTYAMHRLIRIEGARN
jgi:hypothetical protein